MIGALLLSTSAATTATLWPMWLEIRNETIQMADAHLNHEVAHPGWSFPTQIWSATADLTIPAKQLNAQAIARGYRPACPPTQPGEFCAETNAVLPRGGVFPEGHQPPGNDGWTRPLALEPIRLGVLISEDAEVRWHLPLEDAPPALIAAIIAAEDEDFYTHHGVNFVALIRAAWANARGGGYQQGASTITMQVVRNFNQRKEKTLARKMREIVSAIALDQHLTKDQILQAYLDAPYLGQSGGLSICGFQAAAQFYWNHDVQDLSLGQLATLAGMLPAPGTYAPNRSVEKATARRNLVLDRMAAAGWDVTEARQEVVEAGEHPPLGEIPHPAYLQATRLWLEANVEEQQRLGAGLNVFTAMDVVAQQTTETFLPEQAQFLKSIARRQHSDPLETVGVLIEADTGHLVAVYGGTQRASTDFNRATQATRQVGSAFKPLVYALAFSLTGEDGLPMWRPHHTVSNMYRTFPNTNGWTPKNIINDYSATTTLGTGLVRSQNVATATLLEASGGPEPLIALAKQVGFNTDQFPVELGLALGQAEVTPLEMAQFMAMVINTGIQVSGSPVISINDIDGQTIQTVEGRLERVMSEEAATLTRALMGMVVRFGSGSYTRVGGGKTGYLGASIGKTGTTDQEKDLWYIGGTPDYASVVWLGYDQPARIGGTAADLAAPLWGWWMREIYADRPMQEFEDPIALRNHGLCNITGKRGNPTCELFDFPFLEGERQTETCTLEHPPRRRYRNWSLWGNGEAEEDANPEEE